MEHLILEILKKHSIKDENLANALAEIYELFVEQADRDLASKAQLEAFMKGTQL